MGISRLSRVLLGLALVFVLVAALACEGDEEDAAVEETPEASTAQVVPAESTTDSDSSAAMDADKSDSAMMPHDNDGSDSRMSNEEGFAMAMEFLTMFGSMAEFDKQPKADIDRQSAWRHWRRAGCRHLGEWRRKRIRGAGPRRDELGSGRPPRTPSLRRGKVRRRP